MAGSKPRTVGIIPSRLQSSRLPGKALADIGGLPMVAHVYHRCRLASLLDEVVVATDDEQIREAIIAQGGKVIMTGAHHQTGTDRIAEAAAAMACDIVVNIQGDEALVRPEHIDAGVQALLDDPALQVSILVNPFRRYGSASDIKVVVDDRMNVLYMSRADLPSGARTPQPEMLKAYHVVAFRKPFLLEYAHWAPGRLERIEYNEYLRILERGHRIRAVQVNSEAVSVDTPEDLALVRKLMEQDPLLPGYAAARARTVPQPHGGK